MSQDHTAGRISARNAFSKRLSEASNLSPKPKPPNKGRRWLWGSIFVSGLIGMMGFMFWPQARAPLPDPIPPLSAAPVAEPLSSEMAKDASARFAQAADLEKTEKTISLLETSLVQLHNRVQTLEQDNARLVREIRAFHLQGAASVAPPLDVVPPAPVLEEPATGLLASRETEHGTLVRVAWGDGVIEGRIFLGSDCVSAGIPRCETPNNAWTFANSIEPPSYVSMRHCKVMHGSCQNTPQGYAPILSGVVLTDGQPLPVYFGADGELVSEKNRRIHLADAP